MRRYRHILKRLKKSHRTLSVSIWILATLGVAVSILLLLGPMAWLVAGSTVERLQGKERADAINSVRQTILLSFGGAATIAGAALSIRTFSLTRRGQVTDRFNKAVTQLASDAMQERLGGVYSLEHIMRESERDHSTVIEILCAFTRERASFDDSTDESEYRKPLWKRANGLGRPQPGTKPPADIQSALTVLARRPRRTEPFRPHLIRTSLAGLSVRWHEFRDPPRLTGMFLTASDMRCADLRGADLSDSILNHADMRWSLLENAKFINTRLSGADLRHSYLVGANFKDAHLEEANLEDSEGITAAQLASALINRETVLPEKLREDAWVAARIADCEAWSRAANGGRWCPPPTPAPRG